MKLGFEFGQTKIIEGINILYTDFVRAPLYSSRIKSLKYKDMDISLESNGVKIKRNDVDVIKEDLDFLELTEIQKIRNLLYAFESVELLLKGNTSDNINPQNIDNTTLLHYIEACKISSKEELLEQLSKLLVHKMKNDNIDIIRSIEILKTSGNNIIKLFPKLKTMQLTLFSGQSNNNEIIEITNTEEQNIDMWFKLKTIIPELNWGEETEKTFGFSYGYILELETLGLLSIGNARLQTKTRIFGIGNNIYNNSSTKFNNHIKIIHLSSPLEIILNSTEVSEFDFNKYISLLNKLDTYELKETGYSLNNDKNYYCNKKF